MTKASTGLRTALARAGSSVVAIAEMQTADLIAEMTDEQKAEMSAKLVPAAEASEPKPKKGKAPDDGDGNDDEPDNDEMSEEGAAAASAATPAPALAADPRVKAVAEAVSADGPCKGKAEMALSMLADDDYSQLSASGIIKILGKSQGPSASSEDGEEGARAEMRAALSEAQNSNIDPNGAKGAAPDKAQAASNAWDRVYADLSPKTAG